MSFKSFISRLISSTEKKSQLAHGCTPHPQNFLPLPVSCDFSWQFVSLNVWWHVHLLLLYMCITGYKGVFEHSKHVLLSHLSFSGWTFPFFLVSAIVSTSFFIVRPKPRLPSISFTLSRASVLLMDTEEFSLLLLLMKSPPPLYIYDSINTFSPFKQNKEKKKKELNLFLCSE